MRPDIRKLLWDALDAAEFIESQTNALTLESYEASLVIRYATERAFEIIGEALRRVEANEPTALVGVTRYREIIGFRNLVAHGYAELDNSRVFSVVRLDLPVLTSELRTLLDS